MLYKISNNNIRGLKIMEIEKIELQGNEFRLFYVTIHNEQYVIAEEKLENYIQEMIEQERYHEVENIDTMYAIYIPQEVVDTENEVEIIKSAIDVLD